MSMRAFAHLLDRLSLTSSRNAKLTLIADHLRQTLDPDRGYALAALTGALSFNAAKPAFIRKAVEARMDAQLFAWSYDYVGDLAETVALVWPAPSSRKWPGANRPPELSEVIEALHSASRAEVQRLIEGWLDALDPRRPVGAAQADDGRASRGRRLGAAGQAGPGRRFGRGRGRRDRRGVARPRGAL